MPRLSGTRSGHGNRRSAPCVPKRLARCGFARGVSRNTSRAFRLRKIGLARNTCSLRLHTPKRRPAQDFKPFWRGVSVHNEQDVDCLDGNLRAPRDGFTACLRVVYRKVAAQPKRLNSGVQGGAFTRVECNSSDGYFACAHNPSGWILRCDLQ